MKNVIISIFSYSLYFESTFPFAILIIEGIIIKKKLKLIDMRISEDLLLVRSL